MSKRIITVVDYGRGNLFSVRQALEKCGASVILASTPEEIISADRLVLPGVGAFADGMHGLRELGLVDSIRSLADTGRPFLGICLGMQMMLDIGFEFGEYEGLGILPGSVSRILDTDTAGNPLKIPHIGWESLHQNSVMENGWRSTILEGITENDKFYFVHSFAANPKSAQNLLATCQYGGREISAVIRENNLYGCQFHPEKSSSSGLKVLNNFVNLS